MNNYDDDDLLIIDENEYNEIKKQKEKERSARLGEEATPYLIEGMETTWRTTIIWENEVTHSKRLLFMLCALDMIKLYTNGQTPEQIYEKYKSYPETEYNAMIEYLTEYFAKGQELASQLEQYKNGSLGMK